MTSQEFFEFARDNGAEMMALKFVDMLGSWMHCSYPIEVLDEDIFTEGVGFDGSSIRGWQEIHQSDMTAVCDPDTATMDPFFEKPTVSVIATIADPETGKDYAKCPRHVVKRAAEYIKSEGIADTCFVGPEPEFFIFDEVRYEQNQHTGFYRIDSVEGAWNTARFEEPNLGYKPSFKGGYFPVSPTDTYHDLRGEMSYEMMKQGIKVEAHHHEVATAGQAEIDLLARHALLDPAGVGVVQVHRDAGIRLAKGVQDAGHGLERDRGQRGHAHAAPPALGDIAYVGDGRLEVVQQPFDRGQEFRAVVGQDHAPRGAVEQPHAQFLLELVDLDGQRRLRQRQPLGRRGEAAFAGHPDEGLQMLQRDVHHARFSPTIRGGNQTIEHF